MKKPLDDLLRATMGSPPDGPSTPCLDPETAAAFADGALTERERSAVEGHAADCARCGALLATIVRITPAPAARAWWRTPAFAWLAPAAATAAAVAVWIAVQDRAEPPRQLARHEIRSGAPAAEPLDADRSPARQAQARVMSPSRPAAEPDGPAAKAAPAGAPQPKNAPAGPPAATPAPSAAAAPAAVPPATAADSARTTVEVQQAPAPPAPAEPAPRAAGDQRAQPPAPEAPPRALADATVERPSSVTSSAGQSRVGPLAESVTSNEEAARARMAFAGAGAETTIVSSDPRVRWRLAGRTVLRSTDGGATWQPQSPGVSVPLTGGSSPSPAVCWLVGREGLVLLTLDGGQSWQRLPAPTSEDLTAVRATDGRSASVATAGGHTYSTSDRGGSWRR